MSSSWLEQSIPSTNTSVIDAKSATEQARLIDQETLLTEAMAGPPPEQSAQALEHIHDVLDIGCDPGGWVHTVAQTYPQTQAPGIDVSTTMITYAQAIAHVMRVVTEEAYERLCVQVKTEVQQDTFCGLCFMLSVFGQRPGSENAAPL